MTYFFSTEHGSKAISQERVWSVTQFGYTIQINYNDGDYQEIEGNIVPRLSIEYVRYDSVNEAEEKFSELFQAMSRNEKVFAF